MTHQSTDLYSDEIACHVRDVFTQRILGGLTPAEAESAVLHAYPGLLSDHRSECTVSFALAGTQWRLGCLSPRTQMRALALLLSGGDMPYWIDVSGVIAKARAKMLATLTMQLLKPSALQENTKYDLAHAAVGIVQEENAQ